jgi:transposase
MIHAVTVLTEHDDGNITQAQRQFGGFKRDKRARVAWWMSLGVPRVVVESTGLYWKSAYAFLEQAGLLPWVVNAHHVKHVPGRQTIGPIPKGGRSSVASG